MQTAVTLLKFNEYKYMRRCISICTKENLNNREGQQDSAPVVRNCFTWTYGLPHFILRTYASGMKTLYLARAKEKYIKCI